MWVRWWLAALPPAGRLPWLLCTEEARPPVLALRGMAAAAAGRCGDGGGSSYGSAASTAWCSVRIWDSA